MKKSHVTICIILLFQNVCLVTEGQNSPSASIELKSPRATDFERTAIVKKNLQTGQVSPDFIFHTISTNEISVPIGLSYSNSGLRIGEIASSVGLGWQLLAGGLITQSVRGLPDQYNGGLMESIHNQHLLKYLKNEMSLLERAFFEYDISTLTADSERDIFTFNFLTFSGSFYFDGNGNIKCFNDIGLKISFDKNQSIFTILDVTGIKYTFSVNENTSVTHFEPTENNPVVVSGKTWFLTEITTPKNDVFSFEYSHPETFNQVAFNASLSWGAKNSGADQYGNTSCYNDYSMTDVAYGQTNSVVSEVHLKRITWRNLQVEFTNCNIREDLIYNSGKKGAALCSISFKNNNVPMKMVHFHFSHFLNDQGQAKNRLKLEKFTISDYSGHVVLPYSLKYYNETSSFPPLDNLSKDFDHWGYYNGANNSTTIPTFDVSQFSHGGIFYGANKTANGTFSKYGMLREINYPTGGRVSFIYEPNFVNLSSLNSLPIFFNALPSNNFQIGGNRIKAIEYNDGLNAKIERHEFEYSDEVTLKYVPNYIAKKDWHKIDQATYSVSCGNRFVVSDKPYNAISGRHIEYQYVIEKANSNQTSGYTKTFFRNTENIGSDSYPFAPVLNTTWTACVSRVENYESNLNNEFFLVNKLQTDYTSSYTFPFPIQDVSLKLVRHQIGDFLRITPGNSGVWATSIYAYVSDQFKKVSEIESSYRNDLEISNHKLFKYLNAAYPQVSSVEEIDSKGNLVKTCFKYPYDFQGIAIYNDMVTKNLISSIVEQWQTIRPPNVVTERELSRTYLPFKKWDDIGLIAEEKMAKSTGGNEFDVQVTYDLYDGKGNVLQITTKDGIVTSYLWGYNQQYPIAKVIGATYEQAIGFVDMSVINNPNVSDNALRTELAKIRNGLVSSNAMVSTYTYAPLIGMTSETDPNGRTTYYEYDPFGRLMHLRDSKNNILKKYCYNYAGQPITCYDGNFTNSDAYSQSFTKNNCGVGMQGTSVLFQVPAGSVSSSISVADANAKAQQKLQQDGQAYANANGTCSPAPIYAVLSIENQSSSWYSTYGDVIIRFYSDAAHTIPVSVTNQSITIQMEYSDLFNGTGDIQEFSFIANGPDFMAFAGVELSSYDGYYTNWWKYFSLISAPGCLIQ